MYPFPFRYLRHKEHLPVMELRFGDTGTIQDQKSGEHRLGPLRCTGDSMYHLIHTEYVSYRDGYRILEKGPTGPLRNTMGRNKI